MQKISGCTSGLKGGGPPTQKGEKKKAFNAMQYRVQKAMAKRQEEKLAKEKKEAERKKKLEQKSGASQSGPLGDFSRLYDTAPEANFDDTETSSISSVQTSLQDNRSQASSRILSEDSSMAPPLAGSDPQRELLAVTTESEFIPQLSSLAVPRTSCPATATAPVVETTAEEAASAAVSDTSSVFDEMRKTIAASQQIRLRRSSTMSSDRELPESPVVPEPGVALTGPGSPASTSQERERSQAQPSESPGLSAAVGIVSLAPVQPPASAELSTFTDNSSDKEPEVRHSFCNQVVQ